MFLHLCFSLRACVVSVFLQYRVYVGSTAKRPIVTDRVAWSVCLSLTVDSPAKTAKPIEIPFGLRTPEELRNHVLDGV